MHLPNVELAVVDSAKVRDYLLSAEHPVGRAKARVFRALGFTTENCADLQAALLTIARTGDAFPGKTTLFGQLYLVRGILGGSDRAGAIMTVWIVRLDEGFPRFVTAYPEMGR